MGANNQQFIRMKTAPATEKGGNAPNQEIKDIKGSGDKFSRMSTQQTREIEKKEHLDELR